MSLQSPVVKARCAVFNVLRRLAKHGVKIEADDQLRADFIAVAKGHLSSTGGSVYASYKDAAQAFYKRHGLEERMKEVEREKRDSMRRLKLARRTPSPPQEPLLPFLMS